MEKSRSHLPTAALGRRLRQARLARKLSQEDLAYLTDIHVSNIGKVERGQSNPTLETITRLAAALDTSVSELTRDVTKDTLRPQDVPPPYQEYLAQKRKRQRRRSF